MSEFKLKSQRQIDLHGLRSNASVLYVVERSQPTVYVTTRSSDLEATADNIRTFDPSLRVFVYPPRPGSPSLHAPIHEAAKRDRLAFLGALKAQTWDVVITQPKALIEALPPFSRLAEPCVNCQAGETIDPARLCTDFELMGYKRVDLITQVGEYARRGGIVDVFPLTAEYPYRLEFFDDELEEIRTFDLLSQRSLENHQQIDIPPLSEWIPTEDDRVHFSHRGGQAWNRTSSRNHLLEIVSQLQNYGSFVGYEHWTAFFFKETVHLLDLMPLKSCLFLDDPDSIYEELNDLIRDRVLQAEHAKNSKQIYAEPLDLWALGHRFHLEVPEPIDVVMSHHLAMGRHEIELGTRPIVRYEADPIRGFEEWIQRAQRYAVILVCSSKGAYDRLSEMIHDRELTARQLDFPTSLAGLGAGLYLARGNLDKGFEWPDRKLAVLSDHDIFPPQRRRARPLKAGKKAFVTDLRDLKSDDFVVHADHGVGQFRGLVEVEVGGLKTEMMALEYRGQDRLYVALSQLHKIQRHGNSQSGSSLDKLGGTGWAQTKTRAKKAVRKLAVDLVKLYAQRVVVRGIRCGSDTTWQTEFEDSFEFEATQDQLQATQDIKSDLTSGEKPMDRLLVGDVGFGKTEVAMRMAFKLAMDGYQVAILCPTTVLAFQHFMTFKARFAAFPVKIAWLSRFTPSSELKPIMQEITSGAIDILIGTHRILSKDVQFKNLGGIVIDEEQRFGVGHKEKLKQLRKRAHVLSMSATPIPRTLNMALTGIRDISVIETPPRNRLAICTSVMGYRDGVVQNAIRFELDRSGQSYFIHNRVQNMQEIAKTIADLVPEARVGMAHGQMESHQLEKVMISFMNHEIDVLVCSTIIENGVDIPNANTMIINRADHFGLSQLYQLRGRIGRSDRSSFAYLMVPPKAQMTVEARRRLSALEEFSDLGSGFRIAAMDMELRGAGDLLGANQAGHIQAIGYEMFVKLLESTVAELKGEQIEDDVECLLNLKIGAAIPRSFIENTNQRLHYYKLIYGASDLDRLADIHGELEDCYGEIPDEVNLCFGESLLKLQLGHHKVLSVDREGQRIKMKFHQDALVETAVVLDWMKTDNQVQLTPDGQLSFPVSPHLQGQFLIEEIAQKMTTLLGADFETQVKEQLV